MASSTNHGNRMKFCALLLTTILISKIQALPEAGKAEIVLSQDEEFGSFKKITFKNTVVTMTGSCTSAEKESPKLEIEWKIKYSHCAETFLNIKASRATFIHFTNDMFYGVPKEVSCNEITHALITDISKQGNITFIQANHGGKQDSGKITAHVSKNETSTRSIDGVERVVRAVASAKKASPGEVQHPPAKAKVDVKAKEKQKKKHSEIILPLSGSYLLIISAKAVDPTKKFKLKIKIDMKGKPGYLSATEWPLLPFFGVMSLIDLILAICWFVASCCNWRDLLRIQFWIGAVIALGMLEKALFYTEYQNMNITGDESNGLVVFAELVSCMKRTLARILVIIVSMGFGIVKPRLGSALPKILASGLLFFILASIEGCFRALSPKATPSKQQMIAAIPLVVLDSVLCWWIFTALVQTTRTLRIRKNTVKLSLYRHFTNTLVFAVVTSVIYMAWSIKTHTFSDCTDWSEVWLDEAFWPFLFSLILTVIMVLWRPTNNNQRYAFTPLVDVSDDEHEDPALSDAFAGMKLRSMRKESNGKLKNRSGGDDDLKWVEENIPSLPTTVLPSLDSDEEIMTTKLEMSKME